MSLILIWCVSFALYLLFAGEVSAHELICAAVLASLLTAWSRLIRSCSQRCFGFTWNAAASVTRAIASLLPATARTGGALVAAICRLQSLGRAHSVGFRHGAEEEAGERTRRAVAVLCASLAPDRFVVSLERGKEALIHHIVSGARRPDERWLS
ncbi:MAG TPA: hypothetical protein VH684_22690 [Xanthobacteraceae bacterium]|jgi:hypothetical protein